MHNSLLLFCILHCALCVSSCSIPSLEKPQCTEARDAVKRFYSFHIGNDMRPSAESLKASESYLTSDLFKRLSGTNETAKDYFTQTEDYPRAFRVGTCMTDSNDKAVFQVVLLWRDDTRTEQKEVHVEAVKTGGQWLINNVSN